MYVNEGGARRNLNFKLNPVLGSVLIIIGLVAFIGGCTNVDRTEDSLDQQSLVALKPMDGWSDAVIYFVMLDRFADGDMTNNQKVERLNPGGYHGGDLKGLTQHIDEIASLGANVIWLTPINKQIDFGLFATDPSGKITDGFQHWGFHGYWIDDFYQIEPQFGTEEDLKALVEAAHQRNMKVLLDVVYNHTGYSAKTFYSDDQRKKWLRTKNTECDLDVIICQVGGLPDLKTEQPKVRDYLIEHSVALAKRTGIDGFRLDTFKHIDHPFWKEHRKRTQQELGEDFFLLAEVWGGTYRELDKWFEKDETDSGIDFAFSGSCQAFVNGRGRTVAFAKYLEKRHRIRDGYFMAHYLSSHDVNMALADLNNDKDKFKVCVAMQMSSLGMPVIYYGEEVARQGQAWPYNRMDMPWGESDIKPGSGIKRDESLREYYQALIMLRRQHPAMYAGTYTLLLAQGDQMVFMRDHEEKDDHVIVVVNRSDKDAVLSLDLPDSVKNKSWLKFNLDTLNADPSSAFESDLKIKNMSVQFYIAKTKNS